MLLIGLIILCVMYITYMVSIFFSFLRWTSDISALLLVHRYIAIITLLHLVSSHLGLVTLGPGKSSRKKNSRKWINLWSDAVVTNFRAFLRSGEIRQTGNLGNSFLCASRLCMIMMMMMMVMASLSINITATRVFVLQLGSPRPRL